MMIADIKDEIAARGGDLNREDAIAAFEERLADFTREVDLVAVAFGVERETVLAALYMVANQRADANGRSVNLRTLTEWSGFALLAAAATEAHATLDPPTVRESPYIGSSGRFYSKRDPGPLVRLEVDDNGGHRVTWKCPRCDFGNAVKWTAPLSDPADHARRDRYIVRAVEEYDGHVCAVEVAR